MLLGEELVPELLADLFFHGLKDSFVLILGLGPLVHEVFGALEGVDLSERLESLVNVQSLLLLS